MAGAKVRGITIDLGVDASGVASGLKNVNKSISTTSKELRDIEKLLKLDPSNVTLLAQKQQALQRQLTQTRDKLDLLKKAEEELKSKMVDGGTEEQQKQLAALQREIISTERNLDKYTDQLNETEGETKQLTNAEEQAASASEKMSGGFSVLKGALANLVADGLRKAVDGFKDLMTAGPEFADNMLTLAQQTHLSTDTLQELSYMSGLVDVDVNTIAGSLTKLTRNMSSAKDGTGSAAEAFSTLGVSVTDMNGNLRDNEDVFYDTINALGQVENETERDALAMTIFGKSATDLNPLIEAGSDALQGFAKEAHEMGYVLDGDSLEALGRVQDEFDRFQKQMEGAKNQIASGLAPAIERGMKKIEEVVRKIDWQKVGKQMGEAFSKLIDALEWLADNGAVVKSIMAGIVAAMAAKKVANFVSTIGSLTTGLKAATVAQEGMNAAANANPYVLLATAIIALTAAAVTFGSELAKTRWESSALGQEVMRLQSEMEEMTTKTADVVSSFQEMEETKEESIASTIAQTEHLGKLTDELGTLVDANGEVKESDQARAEFILGQLNTALGTEYTMNDLINGQYQEIIQSVNELIEAQRVKAILATQEEAYAQAVTNLSDAQILLAQNVQGRIDKENEVAQLTQEIMELQSKSLDETTAADEEMIESKRILRDELYNEIAQMEGDYQGLADAVDGYVYDINQYESNWEAAHAGHYDAIDTKSWEVAKSMGEAGNEYSTAVATSSYKASNQWMTELGSMLSETSGKKVEFKNEGKGMVTMLVDGIQQGKSLPANEFKLIAQEMVKSSDAKKDMETSGLNAVLGFANSVQANSYLVQGAGRNLALEFINSVKATMDEGSPSKVMARSGLMAVLGFTNEVNDELAMVQQAGINMANAFTQPFNSNLDPTLNGNYSAMTASGMNGANAGMTSNDVTINVYGAEGQDVNLLADVVIDKLQRTINRSEGVYA